MFTWVSRQKEPEPCGEGLFQILRTQHFLPHGAVVINLKAIGLSNVLEIPYVSLLLHCLISFLLSQSIVSTDFIDVSNLLTFPPWKLYTRC